MDVNEYINNLLNLVNNEKNQNISNVARFLLNKVKLSQPLKSATDLASETRVSNSFITKIIKRLKIDNWEVMKYIHNSTIRTINRSPAKKRGGGKIKEAADMISSSRKIFFVGVSSNYYINKDFANKLARLNMWSVAPENKYEQIGLSRLLSTNDVLILNSISLQHKWMINMIKTCHSKIILITSNEVVVNLFKNIDLCIIVPNDKHNSSGARTYSTALRKNIYDIYDKIFTKLIEKPSNIELLKLTSYN